MQGVVNFFGRVSILIDQNTQAFHLFMTALLQVLVLQLLFLNSELVITDVSSEHIELCTSEPSLFTNISFLVYGYHKQLFDRSGMLYGELARFVLRLLGIRTKQKKGIPQGPDGLPAPHQNPHGNQNYIEGPKAAPSGAWDSVWGDQ